MPNSPDPSTSGTSVVSPDKVVARLLRDPLGAALWRACVAEEFAELLQARVAELEQQKSPAAEPPRT